MAIKNIKLGKWIGGGIGWAFGGPIGAIVGFVLGALFDNASLVVYDQGTASINNTTTQPGDFALSLLVLSAAVMKSDGRTMRSELDYVKKFLVNQFGEAQAKQLLLVLNDVLKKEIPVRDVCLQIRDHMPESARLQLLHYLYGISKADGEVSQQEIELIERIAGYMNISGADAASLKAMYYRDLESDYRILEVSATASDEEIKKAYRVMAKKYHPDKVQGMGEAVQKAAEEKFKTLNDAYESIKRKRGMA
jgi:DnaJ like chaperone protein